MYHWGFTGKLMYWDLHAQKRKKITGRRSQVVGCLCQRDQNNDYAEERLIYWIKQVEKYRARIEDHIKEFEKIKDPLGFLSWISGVVETIRAVIYLITK